MIDPSGGSLLAENSASTNNDQPSGRSLADRSVPLQTAEMETQQTIASCPNPSSGEFDVVIEDYYTGLYYLLVHDFYGKTLEKQNILKEEKMAKTMNRKIVITN